MEKTLKKVHLQEIIPYEGNPRKNDSAVEAVMESIRQCEYVAPIIVDEEMVILAGHTRLKALKALGRDEIEIIQATGLTEDQKKKFRILDNKTAEIATWDPALLEIELDGLDFGGFDFGFQKKNQSKEYTEKADIPQYEPTGEVLRSATDLYDRKKTDRLIEKINEADIDEDIKEFLTLSAYRHTVFDYKRIAEYYVNADPEVQDLMEQSALVIIDYGDALKNGFVKLDESMKGLML